MDVDNEAGEVQASEATDEVEGKTLGMPGNTVGK